MAASTGDKITDIRNAARPNSARATGTRNSGGNSLACDNLAGWPTASKVHFVTYQIDSDSNPVVGTQLDCSGIVSGNTIGSFTVIDGTDTGNSVNDVVEMLPTAAWGQDLADALTNQHSRTGAHVGITNTGGMTTDTLTVTSNETVGGTLGVTGTATHSGASVLTGAVSGAGYDLKTIANSYKFSVYRNTAWDTGTGSQFNVVAFDTKTFDTGTNVDIVTNKGRFTAPVAGFYFFTANIGTSTTNIWLIAGLKKNGTTVKKGNGVLNSAGAINSYNSVSGLIQLSIGDYVEAALYSNTATQGGLTGASETSFDGFLISAT